MGGCYGPGRRASAPGLAVRTWDLGGVRVTVRRSTGTPARRDECFVRGLPSAETLISDSVEKKRYFIHD